MTSSVPRALAANFLGRSPTAYKIAVLAFLVANPVVRVLAGPFVSGWLLLGEFVATLAMAFWCYPLGPGGLLVIEALGFGLASPLAVYDEVHQNLPVLLLLVFMLAGIYFLKDLLLAGFTRLLVGVRSKVLLSVAFCVSSAFLSAFLDALTVIAVVITAASAFHGVYHRVASGRAGADEQRGDGRRDENDAAVLEPHRADLDEFRGFLRNIVMHAAIGTVLGGALTLVGEPQNLLIGDAVGWHFVAFFRHAAPVTLPVFAAGLAVCAGVERFHLFGYGARLPPTVRSILVEHSERTEAARTPQERAALAVQLILAGLLLIALSFHLAQAGLLGLALLVVATALNGVTKEADISRAFEEALPFTALLVVFFAVVAIVRQQHLFDPIMNSALALSGSKQLAAFYAGTAALSIVSDNVFVASISMSAVDTAFAAARISRSQFELAAVAINAGTNFPSVATPSGQAALLFLLTSGLSTRITLSYGRMVRMALPYAIVISLVGLAAILTMT